MSDTKKKNWFARHKVMTLILAFIAIGVIVSAASGGNSSKSGSIIEYRFAERADKQAKDVEVVAGEAATVGGVKMTVSKVEYKTSMSTYETAGEGKTYVVADVVLENTSDKTRPYNVFDFRIQTAGGQVLDGDFASVPNPLNSGDMVAGGKAQGQIVFNVPVEAGHQYIIWKPSFDSARAIVQAQ